MNARRAGETDPAELEALRCAWSRSAPEFLAYHDQEWGHPVSDDVRLFEKLCLEGFQSGLSWRTIYNKREAFREVFEGFEFERVARFGPRQISRLLADPRIVRHRGKIEATINNAQRACELVSAEGSLAAFVWRYEPQPKDRPARLTEAELRKLSTSAESIQLSKDLKKRGWRFVGPTTVYSFMQAMGLVNDHVEGCPTRPVVEAKRSRFRRPRPRSR